MNIENLACYLFFFSLYGLVACDKNPVSKPASNLSEQVLTSELLMLQGRWQNEEDEKETIEFRGLKKISEYAGLEIREELEVSVSNACNDKPHESLEGGKYINEIKISGLCYYIVKLHKNQLELSYVGRGNTLRYKKVK